MVLVEYGMNSQTITDRTGVPGKSLFKFIDSGKEYFVVQYKLLHKEEDYLFIYENDALFSIIGVSAGLRIWEATFGDYGKSLPNENYFKSIVELLKNNRLPQSDFFNKEEAGNISGEPVETLVAAGVIYSWIPGVAAVLIGSGLAIKLKRDIEFKLENSAAERVIYKNSQNNMGIQKNTMLGRDFDYVVSVIGPPSFKHVESEITLLVYIGKYITIYSFYESKLQWVAFDYPLEFIQK